MYLDAHVCTDHPSLQLPQHRDAEGNTINNTRTVCGRAGGAVVGWNYLMAISPVGQAAYRARGYAAAKLPLVSASSVPTIKVVVVDRGTHTRRFLNAVSV